MDSQLCRLCLQKSNNAVSIGETFRDSTIATVLEKHFLFLQVNKNDGLSEWLCEVCWTQTRSFHEFYQKVEELQKSYRDSTKNDCCDNDVNDIADISDSDWDLTIEETKVELQPVESKVKLEPVESQSTRKDDADISDTDWDLTIEETKVELQPIESKVTQKDDDSCVKETVIENDENQPVDETPQSNTNGKLVFRIKGSSLRESDDVINKKIKEEQNKELNGQIHEFYTMKCDLCSAKDFDTLLEIKRHYRNMHKTRGYLKCCDMKLHSRSQLLDHIRQHLVRSDSSEENAAIYEWFKMKCDICENVAFKTMLDMRRHYRAHKVRGYLFCVCCNKKFVTRHSMISHIRLQSNPDTYHCEQCDKSFTTSWALKLHIENHVPLDSRAFKCNLCSSSFPREAKLKVHIRDVHNSKTGKKFRCEECNRNYPSALLLKCHIRHCHQNLPDYVCELCARQFKSKYALRFHLTEKHSAQPQPRLQCDICGNCLKNRRSLITHMKQQHQSNDTISCHICNKKFAKFRLRGHIRYVHGERRQRCTLCAKAFHNRCELKEHVATHTGEDLYKCRYCDKKFKSSANLSAHVKKSHYTEWLQNNKRAVNAKN